MKKAIFFGLIAAVLIGAMGRGDLPFILISMSVLLYIGIPSITVILLSAVMKYLSPKRSMLFTAVQRYAAIIFVFVGLQSLGIPIGSQLHQIDLQEAKVFCETLSDQPLEQRDKFFKKSEANWQDRIHYGTDSGNFFCSFADPGTIFTTWLYQNGQWVSD